MGLTMTDPDRSAAWLRASTQLRAADDDADPPSFRTSGPPRQPADQPVTNPDGRPLPSEDGR